LAEWLEWYYLHANFFINCVSSHFKLCHGIALAEYSI